MTQSESGIEDQDLQEIMEKENLELEKFLEQGGNLGINSIPQEDVDKVQQIFLNKSHQIAAEVKRGHDKDNYNLNRPVTEEEIKEVIIEMHNGKAPSLNGFNVDFFKTCWRIVKQNILEVVEDSRRFKTILKALNESFIALIPKQEKATSPDRFRPIALCNVVYKIISKVIVNRLKPLLPTLVLEEQTGYVEGRQILNNIIQAHEVVHSLITNK
eukprot:PITA_16327